MRQRFARSCRRDGPETRTPAKNRAYAAVVGGCQFTVSESDPDVAVTVTVDVTCWEEVTMGEACRCR